MKRLPFAIAMLLSLPLQAAITYRFTDISDGRYASHSAGTVTVDGKRWRIDLDQEPDGVMIKTAVIHTPDDEISLNDQNQTWYRARADEHGRWASSMLFSYGIGAPKVSKIDVKSLPADAGMARITFSYTIDANAGPATVRGFVTGEIRLWFGELPPDLPWMPLEIGSGLPDVDAAFDKELAKLSGRAKKCELEVSRRLEDGPALKETTTREIGEIRETKADPRMFVVPKGYRYQEPVIGAPGAE